MADRVTVHLLPGDASFEIERGASLQDQLFEHGVEFPCGGTGSCRGCRVQLCRGEAPITPADRERLSETELSKGWRLACQCKPETNIQLRIAQWEMEILGDDAEISFSPKPGYGVVVDVGTTTVAAQLIDRSNGRLLASESALNPQAAHGADVVSRIRYAIESNGLRDLTQSIHRCIAVLIASLAGSAEIETGSINEILLVGNTAMHHFACGLDPEPLASLPFHSPNDDVQRIALTSGSMPNLNAHFLPCLGGFVGSDLLAGILAVGMHERDTVSALVDLGTNGEIVMGNRERIVCASTAAGPAFEGGGIAQGMRAVSGAIRSVHIENGAMRCDVIGGGEARGICGSGLVDATAAALRLGFIAPGGKIETPDKTIQLTDDVSLTQSDIRHLQLAKGAIAAGFELLAEEMNIPSDAIENVYLAGAFGNYLSIDAALAIGLLPAHAESIHAAGNTALRGVKLALGRPDDSDLEFNKLRKLISHIELACSPGFQERYAACMRFPG